MVSAPFASLCHRPGSALLSDRFSPRLAVGSSLFYRQFALTLVVNQPVLAAVLRMLLAVTQLHLVNLEVVFFLLFLVLIVAVLSQSVHQLHEDLVVNEAAFCATNRAFEHFEPAGPGELVADTYRWNSEHHSGGGPRTSLQADVTTLTGNDPGV